MSPNTEDMRSEMAKLQVELSMLRQTIGSLSRVEQENVQLLQAQTDEETFDEVANLMPREQQSVRQLEEMKEAAEQLRSQIEQLQNRLNLGGDLRSPEAWQSAEAMQGGRSLVPDGESSDLMGLEGNASTTVNDPMQTPT